MGVTDPKPVMKTPMSPRCAVAATTGTGPPPFLDAPPPGDLVAGPAATLLDRIYQPAAAMTTTTRSQSHAREDDGDLGGFAAGATVDSCFRPEGFGACPGTVCIVLGVCATAPPQTHLQ